MEPDNDTIVALATPPGRGGVGIIRVSGPLVNTISAQVLKKQLKPRYATLSDFFSESGDVVDKGIALYFSAPHSFTGEDVLEFHGHGGAMILDIMQKTIFRLGARMAQPGEFSKRAFLKGKIDLIQAEAIADLIDASSVSAAQCAMRSLQGEFSRRIENLIHGIVELRKYIEAALDFPDEEINFLSKDKIDSAVQNLLQEIKAVKETSHQGALLNEGVSAIIIGKPNVGKSSLLNKLSGEDTAIVTDIPGTTRDILRTRVNIDGIPLHLLDTAGLCATDNIVEKEGVRRAKNEVGRADIVLLVIDVSAGENRNPKELWAEFFTNAPDSNKIIAIYNKIDLTKDKARSEEISGINSVFISAKTGDGLNFLRERVKLALGFNCSEGVFSARRRHLAALEKAAEHLSFVADYLAKLPNYEILRTELIAEDLRQAHLALQEITGEFSSQDLLNLIFSEFCIGK